MRHHLQAATSEFAVSALAGQYLHAHPLPLAMIVDLLPMARTVLGQL